MAVIILWSYGGPGVVIQHLRQELMSAVGLHVFILPLYNICLTVFCYCVLVFQNIIHIDLKAYITFFHCIFNTLI